MLNHRAWRLAVAATVGLLILVPGTAGGEKLTKNEPDVTQLSTVFSQPEPKESLEINSTTVEGKLAIIVEVCPTLYDLVWAIGRHESGNWQHWAGKNNAWGRKSRSGGWASWSSFAEASKDECEYLTSQYVDKGLVTLRQINTKYAEDQNWSKKVERYLPIVIK